MIQRLTAFLFTAAILNTTDIGVPDHSNSLTIDGGLRTIIGVVFAIVGGTSVVFIIIGAIKYILSGGDSSGVKSAKETIIYAVAGLVVALLAFGIVNFITTQAGTVAQ